MKKKIVTLILATLMAFSFTACGSEKASSTPTNSTASASTDSEEESNFERYKVIKGEEGKVAIACKDEDEQQAIVEDLVKQGYKFMITNTNIELIYLNALADSDIAKKEVEA